MRPPRRLLLLLDAIFLFLLAGARGGVCLAQAPQQAQPPGAAQSPEQANGSLPAKWNEAVRELAEKIASATQPSHKISFDVKNMSSLGSGDVAQVRQALELELGRKSIHVAVNGVRVRVTLSEGIAGYVWVVEVRRNDSELTAAVGVARSVTSNVTLRAAPVIQRRTIWQQGEPFLDFAEGSMLAGTISVLSILEPDRIARYRGIGPEQRQFFWSWPFSKLPISKDTRGRLVPSGKDEFQGFVAGNLCVTHATSKCGEAPKDQWPVGDDWKSTYFDSQNFFTGLTETTNGSVGKQIPFFAVSRQEYDHGSDWILTEPNGTAQLYKSSTRATAIFSGWGDDIATVKPGCAASWLVLVTGSGDWTQVDHVQLYEIKDDQAQLIGQPLEFPGPILTLWQSDDWKSVRVVSRNLQTGMYEASIVSVSCSN